MHRDLLTSSHIRLTYAYHGSSPERSPRALSAAPPSLLSCGGGEGDRGGEGDGGGEDDGGNEGDGGSGDSGGGGGDSGGDSSEPLDEEDEEVED